MRRPVSVRPPPAFARQPPASARLPRALARRPWHLAMASLAAGLALAEAGPRPVVGIGALLAGGLALLGMPRLGALTAALLLVGAAVGDLRIASIDAPAERIGDGERVALRGILLTPPRPNAFGSSAELGAAGGRLAGARLLIRAPRWSPLSPSLRVGDELEVRGRLSRLGSAPALDFAAYLRRRGVAGELLLDHARPTGRRRGGIAGSLDRMRDRAERAVAAGMDGSDGALLRGMVLGQDQAIDQALREDFRDSGLAHLLAVSGQNVMLLAALALPVLMLAGLGLRGRLAAVAALIALYVPLAGAGPSLQRAGVMGLAGLAAMAASRPASRWYALLLAAAATLAWNPRAWGDPGWQLSFAAVAGILTVGVPLQRRLRRAMEELAVARAGPPTGRALRALAGALADGVAITVAATVATAPLLAHHFGSVPLAGLAANLRALPAVAPAMWLGMLKAALGQAGGLGLPLADALGAVAALPVGYLARLAERCADLPGGQLALPLGSPVALLCAYAGAGAAALAVRRWRPSVGPWFAERAARWRRLSSPRRSAIAASLAVIVLLATAEVLRGPNPPDRLTVRFLDVGQGDATLIQHPDGCAVLFDGGPPEAGVARLLRRAGVRRLALVVATHASRDHHGGLVQVLRRFPVAVLLDGGDGSSDAAFRAVLREARARGVRRVPAIAPLELACRGLRIHVLSPPPRPP